MDTSTKRSTHPPCATAVQQKRTAEDVYPVRTKRYIADWCKHHGSRKQNCKTREPPIATTPLAHTHTPTEPPTLTHQPTHPRRAAAIQQYTYSRTCVGSAAPAAPALGTCRVYPCVVLGFPFFYDSPPPRGARDPSPEGRLCKAPARRVGHRRPFFSRGTQRADVWGRCGTVVVPRGVGWRSGVAAVFWSCYNKSIFKDPDDDDVSVLRMYIIRILLAVVCTQPALAPECFSDNILQG